jgi:predicted flap endonuclease-1-like 5' DNA nuclease
MKLAEDIWRGSIVARTNMIAAANYSAAFYGNAALQSWQLGLTAPLTFWQAVARAVDGPVANDAAPVAARENVVEMQTAPVAAAVAEPVAEVMAEPVQEPTAPEAGDIVAEVAVAAATPNPVLLDAPRAGQGDDLKAVRGIGAKLSDSLNEIGIYHYDQLAGLDGEAIDWLDENITGFKRCCARFDIVSGAASLL